MTYSSRKAQFAGLCTEFKMPVTSKAQFLSVFAAVLRLDRYVAENFWEDGLPSYQVALLQ